MAQRGAEKSQLQSDWGGKGNFGVKPGLLVVRIHNYSTPEALNRGHCAQRTTMAIFTGGVMPGRHLIRQYSDLFEVENEGRWSGAHHQRTAFDRLANSMRRDASEAIPDTSVWMRHRRGFFSPSQRMGCQPLQDESG
jgi:hypothetical protein